ncbi:MAG: 50S ribosomal protein L13 [Magnetococcales bacterium]|nr:50S ribosomal protein L13 [Magnetococcales bacterium]
MKTYTATPKDIRRQWFVIDAEDQVLGRLATEVARRLRGKHKPTFTPSMDTGDFVVVINAEKVRLTGNKRSNERFFWHTNFPGGLKSITIGAELDGRFPERVVERAVRGMLPKNILGRQMIRKLKVYKGPNHPHAPQTPQELKLG